jgi:uroporphyrinogen III methyltransferase/synthase
VRASPPPAPIRESIKAGDFDAVPLHLLVDGAQPRRHRRQAPRPALGRSAASARPRRTLRPSNGLRVDVLAEEANLTSLIDGLVEYALTQRAADVDAGISPQRPSQKTPQKEGLT